MNLAYNLERSANFFGQQIAVIDGDLRFTYEELNQRADRVAAGMRDLGIAPGDRVGLCAPNSADWLAVYFGAIKCGAVAVTLSSLLSAGEFAKLIGHSRPVMLFASAERLADPASLKEAGVRWTVGSGGDLELADLMSRGQLAPIVERHPDDVACVLYTGGTTGEPKGVMLTHENVLTTVNQVVACERSTEQDRALCFLPFNHVFGQMHIMNATVQSAGGLVLMPGFDLQKVLDAVVEHRITKLFAVPTVYVRLLQVPDLKARLEPVRYCFSAAASMARDVVAQWKLVTGLNIHEAYGMTETASLVTYNHYHRHKVGSVGTSYGATEVTIQDDEGNILSLGSEGEICVRGRGVMKGYLENPTATAEALKGGWLRTEDVGYLDAEGYLFIVDRLKDLIITGGENVYPKEVEEVLHQRPEVMECAVIGLPDPEYGERVTAYLVLANGGRVDHDELKAFCREHLAPYKVPKEFVAMESLPTSAAGKILKRELRDMVRS